MNDFAFGGENGSITRRSAAVRVQRNVEEAVRNALGRMNQHHSVKIILYIFRLKQIELIMTAIRPKSSVNNKRKAISDATRQMILLEAGYKCGSPTCRHILTLELHHIVWVKEGGSNDPENLLALCPNCHSLHTKGYIPTDAIVAWKSLLVSLNNPNRATVDLLLVLYKEEKRVAAEADPTTAAPPFRFTGYGLGVLAGLISSGLVEISRRYLGASMFGGGMPSFEVRLTESGGQLVEAWLRGSPDAIADALHHQSDRTKDTH